MNRKPYLFVAISALSGCSATPPPLPVLYESGPPVAPPAFYDNYGSWFAAVDACASTGYMNIETAGKALLVLNKSVESENYLYSSAKIDAKRKEKLESALKDSNKDLCNKVAIATESKYLELMLPPAPTPAPARNNTIITTPSYEPIKMPVQTNCFTIGFTTSCTSY